MNGAVRLARRRWLMQAAGAAAGALCLPLRAAEGGGALQRIRARGSLVVGLYHDMPPFHVDGAGIDVDLAGALAEQLGVKLAMLPFHADENMADDLRNLVWRGHYLGWGPADLLMHVPAERALAEANPKVRIVAPYYRERLAIARRRDLVPALDSLSVLRGHPVAVAGQSLAGWLLIGADDGALRDTLITRWPHGAAAVEALRDGQVEAAAGLMSELESVLHGDGRFVIEPLVAPRAPRNGWGVGCAVKAEANDLADALQQAMQSLAASSRLAAMFEQRGVHWRV